MTLSERHESHLADVLPGGQRVAGSGSKRESHDVSTPDLSWWQFRYEAKATQKKSYSLKLLDFKDLVADVYSRDARERPAWAVRYYGPGDPEIAPVLQDVVVIDLNDWVELLEELGRLRGKEEEPVP